MLTPLAGICPLALPAAVLRSMGSFLTTYECLVAVRTCKNNEDLKPLLSSIEKIDVSKKDNVLSEFVSVIEPSLISSIGCSVKDLKVLLEYYSVGPLVQLLPRLGSLQRLEILLDGDEIMLVKQVFPLIPMKVRCLTLGRVDAEALEYLGEDATAGCLPALEELAFPSLRINTTEGMMGLQTALMAPCLGKKLKVLFLDFPEIRNGTAWPLLEPVLNTGDQASGILSSLETLVLRSFTDWRMLAEYLLPEERLPGLKEVYNQDHTEEKYVEIHCRAGQGTVAWYEMASQQTCCRSWFELLHHRPLQTFIRKISFQCYSSVVLMCEKETVLELFRCLSNRAIEPKGTIAIKELDLMKGAHDLACTETFEALAGVIRSGSIRSLESLSLLALTTCSSESLASLGKVLDRAFLPFLTFFCFGMDDREDYNYLEDDDYNDPGDLDPEEWFELMNSLFGCVPTGGLDNLRKLELQVPLNDYDTGILLRTLAKVRPNCFRHLPELCLEGAFKENIRAMALVFEAGIFPSVERVTISGRDEGGHCGKVLPRLLRALSDYTNIKELHLHEILVYGPKCMFAPPFLESMLTLLSGSPASSFFLSLQKLQVTIDHHRYDFEVVFDYTSVKHQIESLLLSIKALRAPNLTKAIIFGESDDGMKKGSLTFRLSLLPGH